MYKLSPAFSPVLTVMFSLIFALLVGCQPADKKSLPGAEPQCLAQQSECVVHTQYGDFRVLFNVSKVLTETPFEISVEYLGNKSVNNISGYLEGRDMFMGKIPLFLTGQREHKYLAEVMLGSCAQSSMIWRLWLTAEFTEQARAGESEGKDKQQFFIDFPSSNQ
ncbi:hypothetical protein [Thalassomonas haliotis]|uniref:Lipoprotein n=1 Tax=Thalassomonas haliotis TaxID=485448 RepID=A0ABY7V8Q6_9GAMM|nr:hypothetical protein [Thalassomonas haliotis]WDE10025.1 hypothetical protein H3N35_17180 [Thalassomonas haliotis]